VSAAALVLAVALVMSPAGSRSRVEALGLLTHARRRLPVLPCAGVVYLWGLDAPPIEGLTYAKLKSASEMMCRGALGILHALAETRSKHPAGRRLWFVTANTQSPEGPARHIDPVQAPLAPATSRRPAPRPAARRR